jgi:DNA polymerase type B, organellar and viral
LYNAEKYGYKFNILRGYIFEKENIFKEFVEFLYNMKANSASGSPDYIIAKLLMNSLYGRLGMNQDMENHIVISNKDFSKIFGNREDSITNVIQLKKRTRINIFL